MFERPIRMLGKLPGAPSAERSLSSARVRDVLGQLPSSARERSKQESAPIREGQMTLPIDRTILLRARRGCAGKGRRDLGSSLAEFALVLPVLVMLVFGIVEFGITFTKAQAIEAAAREGARLASIEATTIPEIEARVNDALTGIPMATPAAVAVPTGTCLNRPGETVRVEVTATHVINIPLVLSNYSVNLNGTAVFRCEAAA